MYESCNFFIFQFEKCYKSGVRGLSKARRKNKGDVRLQPLPSATCITLHELGGNIDGKRDIN